MHVHEHKEDPAQDICLRDGEAPISPFLYPLAFPGASLWT